MIPLLVPQEAAPTGAPPDARAESGDPEDVIGFGAFFTAEDITPKGAHFAAGAAPAAAETESGEAVRGQKTDNAEAALPKDTANLVRSAASNPSKAVLDQGGQSQSRQAGDVVAVSPDAAETSPPATPKESPQALRSTVAQSVVEGQIPPATQAVKDGQHRLANAKAAEAETPAKKSSEMMQPDSAEVSSKRRSAAFQSQASKSAAILAGATEKFKGEKLPVARTTRPTPMVQPPAVALAYAVQVPHALQTEPQIIPRDPDVGLGQTPGDRPAAIGATVAGAAPGTGPETAHQIAVAVTSTPDKMTEILLNPEELGRVRLSMTASEGAITLNVAADRPETMDLLRRHIDALAQEFRELGYDSLSFSFGSQTEGDASEEMTEPDQPALSQMEELAAQPNDRALPLANAGLDLRL
jgi:flagellar hook-length control protein FliK